MKIVVIGGTGLIGSKVVAKLGARGHEALAASPNSGVNSVTGQGLREALAGASVVVDVSNSPSFEDAPVLEFFTKSTKNLLTQGAAAGITHYVALSVVGTERLQDTGYFRAKAAQEELIKNGSIPYTIVRATQFFEFAKGIADAATQGNTILLPPIFLQPLAAEDVAQAMAETVLGPPVKGTIEVAGPEQFRIDDFVRKGLAARKDPREVVVDANAPYYGGRPQARAYLPGDAPRTGAIRFEDWLRQSALH